jgi:hypothetical protein
MRFCGEIIPWCSDKERRDWNRWWKVAEINFKARGDITSVRIMRLILTTTLFLWASIWEGKFIFNLAAELELPKSSISMLGSLSKRCKKRATMLLSLVLSWAVYFLQIYVMWLFSYSYPASIWISLIIFFSASFSVIPHSDLDSCWSNCYFWSRHPGIKVEMYQVISQCRRPQNKLTSPFGLFTEPYSISSAVSNDSEPK